MYRDCGKQRTAAFEEYCINQVEHTDQAAQLLRDAAIDTEKRQYGLNDAEQIQMLLNARYGANQIRLVIFSAEAQNRIVWKGWNGRTSEFNLCLYHEQNHYSFIGEPKQMLKVSLAIIFLFSLSLSFTK